MRLCNIAIKQIIMKWVFFKKDIFFLIVLLIMGWSQFRVGLNLLISFSTVVLDWRGQGVRIWAVACRTLGQRVPLLANHVRANLKWLHPLQGEGTAAI